MNGSFGSKDSRYSSGIQFCVKLLLRLQLFGQSAQLGHELGILVREVVAFAEVGGEVVEFLHLGAVILDGVAVKCALAEILPLPFRTPALLK